MAFWILFHFHDYNFKHVILEIPKFSYQIRTITLRTLYKAIGFEKMCNFTPNRQPLLQSQT